MKNSIIAVLITTSVCAPIVRIADMYLAAWDEQHSLLTWVFIVSIACTSSNIATWLIEQMKK